MHNDLYIPDAAVLITASDKKPGGRGQIGSLGGEDTLELWERLHAGLPVILAFQVDVHPSFGLIQLHNHHLLWEWALLLGSTPHTHQGGSSHRINTHKINSIRSTQSQVW